MNYDLSRGYKKYDAIHKDIEGILEKLSDIFNVEKFQKELKKIDIIVDSNKSVIKMKTLTKKTNHQNMQEEFEALVYDPYINDLKNLKEEIENELYPFYKIYLLYSKINLGIDKISNENIVDVIDAAKRLISSLNLIEKKLTIEEQDIINKAYKALYDVILYEEIFTRNDILEAVKKLNTSAFQENLGRLLANDIKKLKKEEIIDEELKIIDTEGLGFDYLNEAIINKISRRTVGETNSIYQKRKKKTLEDLNFSIAAFEERKNSYTFKQLETKHKIKNLKLSKNLLKLKAVSIVLIPVITFTTGYKIGRLKSNEITEYQTITQKIDLNTGKLLADPQKEFDEKPTTYVATILECSPWYKKDDNNYIRNITAYDYINPPDIKDDFHVNMDNLEGNLVVKYQYSENTTSLAKNETTDEPQIILIETYQDKSVTRKSTKFIIPFTTTGAILGLGIDNMLCIFLVYDPEEIKKKFKKLDEKIKECNLTQEQINNELKSMQEDATNILKSMDDAKRKYGNINIDTSSLENKNVRSLKKRLKYLKSLPKSINS